jgi:hypothetical protein
MLTPLRSVHRCLTAYFKRTISMYHCLSVHIKCWRAKSDSELSQHTLPIQIRFLNQYPKFSNIISWNNAFIQPRSGLCSRISGPINVVCREDVNELWVQGIMSRLISLGDVSPRYP